MYAELNDKKTYNILFTFASVFSNSHFKDLVKYCLLGMILCAFLVLFDVSFTCKRRIYFLHLDSVKQWSPNCGTRTTSGMRRPSRWYASRPTFCFSS